MGSRLRNGAIALALLLVLGLAYAHGGRLFGPDSGEPLVRVTGTIEALQVDVSAKIAGRIAERPVNEGDHVSAGQLLVRLDDAEQVAEVHRQEGAVRTAQSTLNDLLADARRQELEDARAALQSAPATLPSIDLSGLLVPIEGMPTGAQYLAAVSPLTYFLKIVRGIILKGVGFEYLWPSLVPLLIFGAAVFSLAVLKFRKQLD